MIEIAAAYIVTSIGCALLSRAYGHGFWFGLLAALLFSPLLCFVGLASVGRTVAREAERRFAIEAHMAGLREIDLRSDADIRTAQRIEPRV